MATGLLVIRRQATRLVPYLMAATKRYVGTVRLGVSTTTLDAEGEVVHTDDRARVAAIDEAAVRAVLPRFTGLIEQRPPAFSAIRVDGKRLHALARAGRVEAPLRQVTIEALDLIGAAPPDFELDVACSKGTYIRFRRPTWRRPSGSAATWSRSGAPGERPVQRGRCAEPGGHRGSGGGARPPAAAREAVAFLPGIALTPAQVDHLRHGRRCAFPEAEPGVCRAVDAAGRLVALVEARGAEPADIIRASVGRRRQGPYRDLSLTGRAALLSASPKPTPAGRRPGRRTGPGSRSHDAARYRSQGRDHRTLQAR
ncbi:MAG: hypothetical protein R3F43_18075 [bacterium]